MAGSLPTTPWGYAPQGFWSTMADPASSSSSSSNATPTQQNYLPLQSTQTAPTDSGSTPEGQTGAGSTIGSLIGDAQTGASAVKGIGGLANSVSGGGNTLGGLLGAGTASEAGSLMGDIIPGIGAAAGIYGMAQNKGNLANILSGAETGASIGSIVPGIGTLIGGGIGALAGGVEDLFNIGKPSQTELQGRTAQSQGIGQITQNATPAEQAEAQNAVKTQGWADPQQALGLIVTRDALINSGMPAQQAIAQSNSMLGNLYKSEQGGTSSVQSALSPIEQALLSRG